MTPLDRYRKFRTNQTEAGQLGWGNARTQEDNFRRVIALVEKRLPLVGLTVHDAGAGYGHLLPHLQFRGVLTSDYIGTDYMADAVARARSKYPGARFERLDLLHGTLPVVDVTFVLGTFAFYKPDEIEVLLNRLWQSSRKALAFCVWWGLTPNFAMYEESKETQRRVLAFVKKHAPNSYLFEKPPKLGEDALFVLFRK